MAPLSVWIRRPNLSTCASTGPDWQRRLPRPIAKRSFSSLSKPRSLTLSCSNDRRIFRFAEAQRRCELTETKCARRCKGNDLLRKTEDRTASKTKDLARDRRGRVHRLEHCRNTAQARPKGRPPG